MDEVPEKSSCDELPEHPEMGNSATSLSGTDTPLLLLTPEGDLLAHGTQGISPCTAEGKPGEAVSQTSDALRKAASLWARWFSSGAKDTQALGEYLKLQVFDVDDPMDRGVTFLMYASEQGSLDGVRLLVENGADVNRTDDLDSTAIMYAAYEGNAEVVEYLLEQGADISMYSTSFDNAQALHYLEDKGQMEIVALIKNALNSRPPVRN